MLFTEKWGQEKTEKWRESGSIAIRESFVYPTPFKIHMPRIARIEIEGGLYHGMKRANDRKYVFHSREDRYKFIQRLIARIK